MREKQPPRMCAKCYAEQIVYKQKRTDNQYRILLHTVNTDAVPLERYISANTPILHFHKLCKHVYKRPPMTVLYGAGCAICRINNLGNKPISHDKFVEKLHNINPNIKVLGKYSNSQTDIKLKCLVCDYEWEARPSHLIQGHGCPQCGFNKIAKERAKSHDDFVNELYDINPYIEIMSEYTNCRTKIQCKCLLCNNVWDATPSHLLRGEGCPICNESIGERNIRKYLDTHNIRYIREKRFDDLRGQKGRPLSFDFFLIDYFALIEFQGEQHEKSVDYFGGQEAFTIQQEHDRKKRTYALANGYNFLEIFYRDRFKIDTILTDFLNNLKLETVETTGIV